MSIWDAFGKGRYKGFSREAGQLLDKAVELAGGLGCKKADTGHLLWAMLQADGGPAARFLAGKNISELEVFPQDEYLNSKASFTEYRKYVLINHLLF